ELLDKNGKLLHRLLDRPLVEELPLGFGAVVTGPRGYSWRPDRPATLTWIEAQDGGDPKQEAPIRDRVWQLDAPFTGEKCEIAALEMRFAGLIWSEDGLALISEFEWKTRRQRTWTLRPGAEPRKLFDRLTEDRYSNPGSPVMKQTAYGTSVMDSTDSYIYMIGAGASPEGDRPFLDRLNLETGKTERLWRSEAPYYEYPIALTGNGRVLTSRESVSEPPNYYERDLKTGSLRPLTSFPHPTPQLKGVHKELITYKRKDGVQLTGTLYLPPGYKKEQGPLPVVMWAYPKEFKTTEAASQVSDSPYRFVRISYGDALFLLTQGYAVVDDPSFPIVGEGEKEPNDSYIEQLVASAEAAIDELVRRGVGDRNRVAVGGHSYGAFMTANLLAHSRLFRAGIARSGAYNRTLTPFGFQSEERTLWQAPETYVRMSPFMYAEQIKDPILLIHGEMDNNPGTYPVQSERFYQALKGLGGTVRYVVLPNEAHSYRARESVLHTLWEMTEWLERYVKGKSQ
ncbi:MAG: prolyl oligopeptidase family serine peptidase, partial [Candidatus Bathyarchaeia archaeon]